MENGYIKVHRSLKRHWIWSDAEYLKGWLHLLFRVNYAESKVLISGKLVRVKRGETLISLRTLAGELNWSVRKVRTFLSCLKNDTMIDTKAAHGMTQITIIKYDIYQANRHTEIPDIDTLNDTQPEQSRNKKKKNKEEIKKVRNNKRSLTALKSFVELYRIQGMDEFRDIDVYKEFDKFCDRLRNSKPYKDYFAAFRNHLRMEWVPRMEHKAVAYAHMCTKCFGILDSWKNDRYTYECPNCKKETLMPVWKARERIEYMANNDVELVRLEIDRSLGAKA